MPQAVMKHQRCRGERCYKSSLSHRGSPDLCLTTYTISQDDLKSNHVIQLEEPHYFESAAEVELCLRSHYMTFLLRRTESGLLAEGRVMEDEMETAVI